MRVSNDGLNIADTNSLNSGLQQTNGAAGKRKVDEKSFKTQQAEQVAQDFETMFLDLILKTMRETAKPEDATNAQEIYQGMLDGEYAKNMTGSKNFGVRDLVLNWMKNNDPDLKIVNSEAQKTLQELEKSKTAMKFAADQYRMQTLGSGVK